MPSMVERERWFRTKDLYLVSYLVFRGAELMGRDIEQGKGVFGFEDTPNLQQWVREFYAPACEARRLFETFRSVKDYLFDRR